MILLVALLLAAEAVAQLQPHPDNPRYFRDTASGRAVLLSGSHTWSTLVDLGDGDPAAAFDFDKYLEFMAGHGHNFLRLWTWEPTIWGEHVNKSRPQERRTASPSPYARTGPGSAIDGKPKFDLTKYDEEYFKRLRTRLESAQKRGIYVSIMLFEGYGVQFYGDAWKHHPYHGANNIQGIEADRDGDGMGVEVHELGNAKVTALQEAYVRKMIDTVNDLDNVLYEISNENHPASTDWQYHMIRFIMDCEKARAKQHPVGMTFQYKGGSNKTLFDSPADWVSPNPEAAAGYDFRKNPPPADGRKVVLSDTDHLWGVGGDVAWVWKTFMRGHNPIFMDPYGRETFGKWKADFDPVRKNLGYALAYSRRVDLAAMTPQPKLASSGYCLANPAGARPAYLLYLPEGQRVTVDLSGSKGKWAGEWFDPRTGKTALAEVVDAGAARELACPLGGDAVLLLLPAAQAGGQCGIPYAQPRNEDQTLDVYARAGKSNLPVVVWIHGGGWQRGDKADIHVKPQAFMDRGFVFVSVNYRLYPKVGIKDMAADVARAIRWAHDHAGEFGGDPSRLIVMGHSAGAQLAALVCIDERYLKAERLPLSIIKACAPVDGDSYDVPLQIKTVEERRAAIYRRKFGEEAMRAELSSVTHVARGKDIPPFLILHVADHPETRGQSERLVQLLNQAGVSARTCPAAGKNHLTINSDLGLAEDGPTQELFGFLEAALKK